VSTYRPEVLACDNCIPGQSGHWKVALAAIVLVAVLALALVVLRSLLRGWSAANRVLSVALLLVVLGAGSAGFPVDGETAVAASRSRGWGLDSFQLAHRRNGEMFVHAGQLLFVAAAIAMAIAGALLIAGAIRSPDRTHEHGDLDIKPGR
jgi:hypothetical protein